MDNQDPDLTPRVVRVAHVDLNVTDSASSTRSSQKSRRFSLRSLSGSLSSIWSRESTSRTRSDISQDQASHGCSSFSTLLTTHHALSHTAQQDLLVKIENTPLPALRRVPVSKLPHTPTLTQSTTHKRYRLDRHFRAFPKPLSSQKAPTPVCRDPPTSHHRPGPLQRICPNIMASTSVSVSSNSSNDEPANGGSTVDNHTAVNSERFGVERVANDVSNNGTSADSGFPDGDYVNRVLGPLHLRQTQISSNRTSRNSLETAATSFDETLASRVRPISQHLAQSPNPLRAPRPSLESDGSSMFPGVSLSTEDIPLPAIAAVKIDTFTTTSFGQKSNFSATAHAIFSVTIVPQNASMAEPESDAESDLFPLPPYRLLDNYAGHLTDLQMQTFISGPGTKLVEMGPTKRETLHLGDNWVSAVHFGVKETSLASRLSTSVRSKGNQNLAQCQENSASLSIIEHWLDVLKMDNRKKNEAIVVTVVIKYRHTFMPADTWLETSSSSTIDIFASEAAMRAAQKGKSKARSSADMDLSDVYRTYTADPLQRTLVCGMVVRLLNPRCANLRLYSLRADAEANHPTIRAVDALRLLSEVRECFGSGQDYHINLDLGTLEEYYKNALTKESHPTQGTTIARSVRRHAQTIVKKLSPQKLVKKSSGGGRAETEGSVM
ncbi:hypothetical protein A1O1_04667 [Capronia coronata CBS 617.96]|uniref:Uncharacterized protein n=1 Tax=Capronia coronata CBS 617.96 TaxID=1182541 RepID=W9YEP8_9EURO|nr:uncharacterized protein A1O1_04667 [Capronia coronata CBS 617.96]EXJ87741.1 hypothetical protein A1O1_04667 [Capronia coronata CBS 617.96]